MWKIDKYFIKISGFKAKRSFLDFDVNFSTKAVGNPLGKSKKGGKITLPRQVKNNLLFSPGFAWYLGLNNCPTKLTLLPGLTRLTLFHLERNTQL